jgi:hypothetical protein
VVRRRRVQVGDLALELLQLEPHRFQSVDVDAHG